MKTETRIPGLPRAAQTGVRLCLIGCTAIQSAFAQVPDAPLPPPAPIAPAADAPKSAAAPNKGFVGYDIPMMDDKGDLISWGGKTWNVNNNRIFQARFEKYLNAPEETDVNARQYQAIIAEILNRTAQASANKENIDYAFRLLVQGSKYDIDSRLCDSLADAVYTVWTAKREQNRLFAANKALQFEIMKLEAQSRLNTAVTQHVADANRKMSGPGGSRRNQAGQPPEPPVPTQAQAADAKSAIVESTDWKSRGLAKMVALQTANDVKREISEVQAKVEFQALVLQFFLQRRFQHVLMGTRFYRAIFSDGDAKVTMSNEVREKFTKNLGFSPTISTIDSMANEALRDVRESVRAVEFQMENKELESATKRLGEALIVGEFVPEIRTLPREKKRLALAFAQKTNKLIGAMEAKDYTTAESLIDDLSKSAKDFDGTQPKAVVESSRRGAKMHLLAARNAAQTNDQKTFKAELDAAAVLWPLNPALAEFSDKIFDQGDLQAKTAGEFDTLFAQKNYRQIFDNKERFIAALALNPERQPKLKEAMDHMETIKGATLRAEEMRRQNNIAGAWETVERVIANFPEDTQLNRLRGEAATDAADFVRTVRTAQDLEKKEQIGSSLAWFLKAQKIYPASDFASEGIGRLKKRILPDG